MMRPFHRLPGAFVLSFALSLGSGCSGSQLGPPHPAAGSDAPHARLESVEATLLAIREEYVDSARVKPKEMLLSALDYIQRDVPQAFVLDENPGEVTIRFEASEKKIRTDDVQGLSDVLTKLREVFAYLDPHLRGTQVDLREAEYAACDGILHTLDPGSVLIRPAEIRKMSRARHSAGSGFVMSIRDQRLTIMGVMPDTPAERAGLKRLDRIVKIDDQPTLNMTLEDAVLRLSGDPGTQCTLWIAREGDGGWQGEKPFELTRQVIQVKSVEARPLESGIGYVRLKAFQATSLNELEVALAALSQKGPLRGLVLDLRGNPGGLLDQAAKIADKFLQDGVIVSMVGAAEGRDEKRAKAPGTEPPYPLVVLVSGSSASASEILAGALKNLDRAVIVGARTAGAGSAQRLFPRLTRDNAALRLTVARAFTPGDIPIEGAGITPDIELDSMTIDELEMDLMVQRDVLRERSAFVPNARAAPPGKPSEVLRYQLSTADRERARDRELDDPFNLDFPVRFARDLAQRMPFNAKRLDQLRATHDYVEQVRKDELSKVSAELAKLDVDWSEAPAGATNKQTTFEVKAETDRANNEVTAGEPMELRVTVKNTGTEPVYRLRASIESGNGYFARKELAFGKIAPGASKTAKVPLGFCEIEGRRIDSTKPRAGNEKRTCKIPMDALSRADGMKVVFESDAGGAPAPVELRPTIKALERPLFQYGYQIVDDRSGNGDGRVQKGEQVSMYLTVKNVGAGRSYDTQANIANLSGDGLLLRAGRFDISNMQPGEVRKVVFTFDVQPQLTENEATLSLSVRDRDLLELATEKVKIPIEAPMAVEKVAGVKKAGDGTTLRPSADPNARAFGTLAAGALVNVTGKSGDLVKIDLGGGRFGFVASKDLADASGSASAPSFDVVYAQAPPRLDVAAAEMVTRSDKVKISGTASDTEKLADVYVFVGTRKVFYKSNRDGTDPRKAAFEFDAPLRPGINLITVVARKDPDTVTRRSIIVRKDGPDGSILETPRADEFEKD